MYAAKLQHHRRPLLYVISGTCYLLATLFPRLLSPAFWHSGRMESLAVKYAAAERNSTKFVSHCRCTRRIKLDMFVQIHSSRETGWKERRDAFTIYAGFEVDSAGHFIIHILTRYTLMERWAMISNESYRDAHQTN